MRHRAALRRCPPSTLGRGRPRRRRATVGTLLGAAATLALTGCDASFGMPRGASEQGQETFHLWQTYTWAGIAVAAVVYGLIVWSLLRYRARRRDAPDAIGRQFHENLPIEIAYTAIPVALAAVLFLLSITTQSRVDAVPTEPAVRLNVTAFSWGWQFDYEGQGVSVLSPPTDDGFSVPEVVLPLGEPVAVRLTSTDVIHAFWVPGFLYKRDAIPGHVNEFGITPVETGSYEGICSEFCGLNHAYMRFRVRVVPATEFEAWLAERRAAASASAIAQVEAA